ncbi:MAG: patatin-like phospholipase family protein [Anaerolineales bacterium]|nr:patatin-like phospholipase family protein [Anaerolineales bacterium]
MGLPNFVNKIRSAIDYEFKRNLYKNLVFKGGGIRGIAYMGVLEILDEYRIIENIQRVAGTSAGAIAAAIVSFRLSVPETKELFNSLDFTKVPQNETKLKSRKFLRFPEEESSRRFFKNFGWYSSEYFYNWLEEVIAGQCDGNRRATFSDFKDYGFRDLFIMVTNVSRQRVEIFSADHTPDVAVADAVRMSLSIPVFFEALRFDGQKFGDGDYYVDGGLYDNFPVHIFDHPEYAGKTWAFRDGVNWETLGLFIYPEQIISPSEPEIPDNVWEFLTLTLRNLYHSHEVASYQANTADQHRTIEISDCGIPATDFDIEQGSEKYQLLYESGIQAVQSFFGAEK